MQNVIILHKIDVSTFACSQSGNDILPSRSKGSKSEDWSGGDVRLRVQD